ncbi:MAG: hypothetical protein QM743_13455 [Chitinophagaceae bacterium]
MNWDVLWVFVGVFLVAGFLSEWARIEHWQHRRIFNLFENSTVSEALYLVADKR